MNPKLHPLQNEAPEPQQFTYPFCYEPHPLCLTAAAEVRSYVDSRSDWSAELSQGKMLGVLVVRDGKKRGFLAAFSGTLDGRTQQDYFVPPVFDLMEPGCHFQKEQATISSLTNKIALLEKQIIPTTVASEAEQAILQAQKRMKEAKERRDALRHSLPAEELLIRKKDFIRESQYLKAELQRARRFWTQRIREAEEPNSQLRKQIEALQTERQLRSQALQLWLFQQTSFRNAKGESKNLCDIFSPYTPPGGAGECCAPKLLQYAYLHHLVPLCMAEFWVGASPHDTIRTEGHFYPACRSKCLPILSFMMEGLHVEENPLQRTDNALKERLRIIYEGDDFLVVSKPAGLLSVPGRDGLPNVLSILQERFPQASGPIIVHRLDMDTSGLMMVALNNEAYHRLQALFLHRQVEKTYLALLQNPMTEGEEGTIDLPLAPDFADRPRQRVDLQHGRRSVTHYRVLCRKEGHALVALQPETGRTHQLRVHCAHTLGLGNPIVGDRLYGTAGDRLMLHAWRLRFMGMDFVDEDQDFKRYIDPGIEDSEIQAVGI